MTDDSAIRGLKPDPQHPWRHDNTGRLLLMSLINWQDVLVRGLQASGLRQIRASHLNLLRHIDLDGTRITEIAERAQLSKQAIGQLVSSCEAQKLVKTVADTTDGRAKIVVFTSRGRAIIDTERELMQHMDEDLNRLLGTAGFAALRRSLHRLSEWAGPFDLPAAGPDRARAARSGASRRNGSKPASLR